MKPCAYCGRENSDDALHCLGCGSEFIAPGNPRDKSPSAGFGIRVLARMIDSIYGAIIGFSAGMFGGLLLSALTAAGVLHTGWQHRIHGFSFASLGLAFVGAILYHFCCEGIHGASLGKLCCGICVVNEDGQPSTFRGAFIRNVAYYFDALFCGLVGYESMKESSINQRYGDRWGKTAVFTNQGIPPGSKRSPIRLISGILLGTGCWFVILVLGLVLKATL